MSVAWKNRVEFITVYVREAHPVSEKQLATATNRRAGIMVTEPKTLDERCSLASRCRTTLHLQSTMVVDEIDNRVATAYAAAPDRLYVIDRQGKVAYQGGPGPFGFNPGEMEQSLFMLLLDENGPDAVTPVPSGPNAK